MLLTQSLLTGTYSRRGRCTVTCGSSCRSPPSTAIAPRPRATAAAPWPAGPADHSPASEIQLPPAPPLDRAAGHRPSAGRRGRVRHSRTFTGFQSIIAPLLPRQRPHAVNAPTPTALNPVDVTEDARTSLSPRAAPG